MLREILYIFKGLTEHIRNIERLDPYKNQQSKIDIITGVDLLQTEQHIVKNKQQKNQYAKQCIGTASFSIPYCF